MFDDFASLLPRLVMNILHGFVKRWTKFFRWNWKRQLHFFKLSAPVAQSKSHHPSSCMAYWGQDGPLGQKCWLLQWCVWIHIGVEQWRVSSTIFVCDCVCWDSASVSDREKKTKGWSCPSSLLVSENIKRFCGIKVLQFSGKYAQLYCFC